MLIGFVCSGFGWASGVWVGWIRHEEDVEDKSSLLFLVLILSLEVGSSSALHEFAFEPSVLFFRRFLVDGFVFDINWDFRMLISVLSIRLPM